MEGLKRSVAFEIDKDGAVYDSVPENKERDIKFLLIVKALTGDANCQCSHCRGKGRGREGGPRNQKSTYTPKINHDNVVS